MPTYLNKPTPKLQIKSPSNLEGFFYGLFFIYLMEVNKKIIHYKNTKKHTFMAGIY
jgi:hypothetical protein